MDMLSPEDWQQLSQLTPPWRNVTPDEAAIFYDELRGEVKAGHLLHNVALRVLARREMRDDYLIFAPDQPDP